MIDIKLGILKGYTSIYNQYILSCKDLGIKYEVIDILSDNWINKIKSSSCDGFLCGPPCEFQEWKTIYDERLYILNKVLNRQIYPSFNELYIYENKRMMSYWLEVHGFPHPETYIICKKSDYINFLKSNRAYPLIFKTNVGSASSGVKIIRNKQSAKKYTNEIFGIFNPHLALGHLNFIQGKKFLFPSFGSIQKHYLIIQKFEDIKWEWRIIKIDDSYFGHQKLLKGNFASGSRLVGWQNPPEELLLLVKDICETGNFKSMAVDIFETEDGRFLVNELQSIFGSYDDVQMYINGRPGRYIYIDEEFHFEEGFFNNFRSYLLRVRHFVDIISTGKEKSHENRINKA